MAWANGRAGQNDQYILRASHPHDFQGLVDVIATEVVTKDDDIADTISRMREWAKSDPVMSYGQYENPNYDGNIAIGVQPYVPYETGSIVEHPNRPGEYVLSYVNRNARWNSVSGLKIETCIYNERDDDCEWLGGEQIEPGRAKRIAEIYKLIERSNLVHDGLSFQMEFLDNGESVHIAQVRAFNQKKIANFKLTGGERLVFGVTEPDGIELPVLQSPNGYDSDRQPLSSEHNWAFLKTQHDDPLNLEFQPKNMDAFLISQSWMSGVTPSLEHYHFRFAQKANLTVFENYLFHRHDFSRLIFGFLDPELVQFELRNIEIVARIKLLPLDEPQRDMLRHNAGLLPTRARIISDGKTATVEPAWS